MVMSPQNEDGKQAAKLLVMVFGLCALAAIAMLFAIETTYTYPIVGSGDEFPSLFLAIALSVPALVLVVRWAMRS